MNERNIQRTPVRRVIELSTRNLNTTCTQSYGRVTTAGVFTKCVHRIYCNYLINENVQGTRGHGQCTSNVRCDILPRDGGLKIFMNTKL